MRMQSQSLIRTPPSEEERLVIHEQFLRTVFTSSNLFSKKSNQFILTKKVDFKSMSFKSRIKPANSVWMEDAKLKNMIICQPEVFIYPL